MAIARISEARLRLILKRQKKQAWGKEYIAAQHSTPAEAPSKSHASILKPQKLGGRDFHCLSYSEASVALLCLFHPAVWDVHEQRMLLMQPHPHFLHSHPRSIGQTFKPFRGTLDVAQRMGILPRHPICMVKSEDGVRTKTPFPFLGDLLVFLEDAYGQYAVNLSIKDKPEAFRIGIPNPGKARAAHDQEAVLLRQALEANYYADAGIPTRQVAASALDAELVTNLNVLFQHHASDGQSTGQTKQICWSFFNEHVGTRTPANQLIEAIARQTKQTPGVVKVILLQGIWNRNVKVDLFKPLLLDRPLKPQLMDPIDVYHSWFARG